MTARLAQATMTREDGRLALAEANRRYLDHERVCFGRRLWLKCLTCKRLDEAGMAAAQQYADACFASAAR